ncbi:hypothetical protein M434DRAFT_14197 [Hypoxylon sp. CO27-5]|nr:hypothetical protein M434DRAFT_14197 [Hypoxylon sp. CO27-5]
MATFQNILLADAAIVAGVRRYVPSEYGFDNTSPEAQALSVVFHDKDIIEWTSIAFGMWIILAMANDFVGMHVRERKFTFWDNGDGCFACTTEENTAAGLLLAASETIQGVKYATETINSEDLIKEKHEAVEKGDKLATFVLIEIRFIMGRFGGHLEEELGEIMNKKLGLPKHALDEVAANSLRTLCLL